MRIQFLKRAMTWQLGEIAEVDDATGQWLVNVGKATTDVVEPVPAPIVIPEPVAEPELEEVDWEPAEPDPIIFARASRVKRGRRTT